MDVSVILEGLDVLLVCGQLERMIRKIDSFSERLIKLESEHAYIHWGWK